MTQDLFFTSLLIKSMHLNVSFRRDVVNEVTRFIDKMKKDGEKGSVGDIRVYRHMCQFINDEQDNHELTKYQSASCLIKSQNITFLKRRLLLYSIHLYNPGLY